MRRAILLATLASALFAHPAISQMQIKVLRLEHVIVREHVNPEGQSVREVFARTRLIAPDGRERVDHVDPTLPVQVAEIVDEKQDLRVQLDLQQKTALRVRGERAKGKERRDQAKVQPFQGGPQKGEPLGARLIQGFECQGFRTGFPNGATNEYWSCRDSVSGLTFLGGVYTQFPDGKVWRQDLKSATRDYAADAQLFEIPPDYRVVDQ